MGGRKFTRKEEAERVVVLAPPQSCWALQKIPGVQLGDVILTIIALRMKWFLPLSLGVEDHLEAVDRKSIFLDIDPELPREQRSHIPSDGSIEDQRGRLDDDVERSRMLGYLGGRVLGRMLEGQGEPL